jgi:CRP-like cAMP-binding protein
MFVTFDSELLARGPSITLPDAAARARPNVVRLRPGQTLYHQGDDARSIYSVTKGVLRLARVTEKGHQQVVGFGYPGDFAGFPLCGRRSTDCDALTPAEVIVLSARLPDHDASGSDATFLAAAALWEIGAMQDHLMTLGRKSSRERVASFLVVLMARGGREESDGVHVDLPMSRADIADFLGIRTETVSRAFTDLRRAGLIRLPTAQHVTILRPDALSGMAEAD